MEKQYELFSEGGLTFSNWLNDDSWQEQFQEWIEDGNVTKNADDTYSTQDAQYRNSLKDMDALKKYFYDEYIKGQYDSYADGGSLDDKNLVAKAIEYITGTAIDIDSIQFEANRIAFKYKGQTRWTDISQKLIEHTISMHRKSLEMRGRYEGGGEAGKKTKINKKYKYFAQHKENEKIYNGWEIVDDVESLKHYAKIDLKDNGFKPSDFNIISAETLIKKGIDPYDSDNWYKVEYSKDSSSHEKEVSKYNDDNSSFIYYHEKKGNFLVPKGQVYAWLYDEADGVADKLQSQKYDWVFYPYASLSMSFNKGFIPPLKRIWTKKFQKQHKGSEHLLGVIKAYLLKDGKELYIDMMSVNPNHKKEGIMTYMINQLREIYGLSQEQVTFSELTKEGEVFVGKKTFADGGGVPVYNLIKIEKDPMAYWVEYKGEIIGNVAGIGRFGDWSWSLRTDKVDTTSTYGIFKTKEDASEKVLNEYLRRSNKYADGGDIPNEDKMFQLPLEMVIYVPSTQDVDKVISVDEMNERVNEVKEYLANKFGGYTSADKLGGFVDSKGNLVNEEVTQITSFSTKEAFEENKDELIKQIAKWGKKWGQEAIGFEYEGDLMYVPQEL